MLKRAIIALCSAVVLVVALTGCNTVRGAGEDIESVGTAISGK
jgi:entericidin B